jgi:predicted RNA-binding protein with PIN domain
LAESAVLVDGNNVMGSRPDGWWKDRAGAAKRLVEQLGDWAARSDRDVIVIFDGAPPPSMPQPDRVEVRFASRRGPDSADDDIAELVATAEKPPFVVTSDADLARRVRDHGAEVAGARWLLGQL